jgi:hypothetical protein
MMQGNIYLGVILTVLSFLLDIGIIHIVNEVMLYELPDELGFPQVNVTLSLGGSASSDIPLGLPSDAPSEVPSVEDTSSAEPSDVPTTAATDSSSSESSQIAPTAGDNPFDDDTEPPTTDVFSVVALAPTSADLADPTRPTHTPYEGCETVGMLSFGQGWRLIFPMFICYLHLLWTFCFMQTKSFAEMINSKSENPLFT